MHVEFINGKTYVQGEGTHHINGQTIHNKEGQTTVVEEDGATYLVSNKDKPTRIEELTGMEKHYWESSKGKGHIEWIGRTATRLTKSTNSNWKLPQFCTALQSALIADKIIRRGDKMLVFAGANSLYVNGEIIKGEAYRNYEDMALDYDLPISIGWNLEYDGRSILVNGEIGDVEQLRADLLAALIDDALIDSKKKKVLFKIYGNQLIVNRKPLPKNMEGTYFRILSNYEVVPAPAKIIELNHYQGKDAINVGYAKDNGFFGTFSFE